jgi:iron-sulfur cluster assembly protein
VITLTEQAALKVREMMSEEEHPEKLYLRFSVQYGGCSGLSYGLGFDTEKTDQDEVLEFHGVRVLVQRNDEPFIKGTVIDYKESLMGGGFSIENPNAIATCGCGSSFRTATEAGKPEDC